MLRRMQEKIRHRVTMLNRDCCDDFQTMSEINVTPPSLAISVVLAVKFCSNALLRVFLIYLISNAAAATSATRHTRTTVSGCRRVTASQRTSPWHFDLQAALQREWWGGR
jgi:hypothetical protein